MSSRFYSFKIVTYHTDLSIIQNFCSLCFKYAYILHDKDAADNHYHILATFKGNKSFQSVRSLFPGGANTLVKQMTDKIGDFLYLTHSNCPDKYQYSSEDIVCNDIKYFSSKISCSITNEEFINDISSFSMLSKKQLAIKYGRDYMLNFRRYKDFISVMEDEEVDIKRGYSRYCDLLDYSTFLFDLDRAFYFLYEPLYKLFPELENLLFKPLDI